MTLQVQFQPTVDWDSKRTDHDKQQLVDRKHRGCRLERYEHQPHRAPS